MLRELVQSRSVMVVLVGLYVLSTLGAIPVPSVALSRAVPVDGASCVSVCKCVSCSPESCCCAMLAPADDEDEGIRMLGFSCQPTVTWFLAVLPPAVSLAEIVTKAETPIAERGSPMLADARERAVGVPTPPPRTAA